MDKKISVSFDQRLSNRPEFLRGIKKLLQLPDLIIRSTTLLSKTEKILEEIDFQSGNHYNDLLIKAFEQASVVVIKIRLLQEGEHEYVDCLVSFRRNRVTFYGIEISYNDKGWLVHWQRNTYGTEAQEKAGTSMW